jgi:hypothetical protein
MNPPSPRSRKLAAEEINRAMSRFPLIVRILGELDQSPIPLPGDDDIRHGCERALTGMLSELARIEPVEPGKSSKAEDTAQAWLQTSSAHKLVDVDILQRMQQFIDCILNSAKR